MAGEENINREQSKGPPQETGDNENVVPNPSNADSPIGNSKSSVEKTEPLIINEPSSTENMEVHHHSHSGHHKKTWKNYFWEFLMLFLAVFCGFLAEYQLEHKIEKDRVTKYMHDMVENLKYDTTRVAVNLPTNQELRKDLDSFRYEIKKAINGQTNANSLYYYSLKLNDYGQAVFNTSTITQLKSSGQLRLVKNSNLLNEILDYYDRKVYAAEIYEQNAQKAFERLATSLNNIFSTTPFDFVSKVSDSTFSKQIDDEYQKVLSSVINGPPLQLLTTDKISLEKLHSAVVDFEWSIIVYNRFLNYCRQGAEKLMLYIEEIY